MPEWALVITVGPVGRFIGGGRRSRDLWWGSSWVSECALKIGNYLLDLEEPDWQVELVVPSRDRLERIDSEFRATRQAFGGRISNRILARARGDALTPKRLEALSRKCEETARLHLVGQLDEAHGHLKKKIYKRDGKPRSLFQDLETIWIPQGFNDQAAAVRSPEADFLEVYAAWTPIPEPVTSGDPTFDRSVDRLWKLLDARKSARLFGAPSWTKPGRPKSDLDSGRDSVLRNAREVELTATAPEVVQHRQARQRLGIGPEENLDALSLARRLSAFQPGPELKRLPFPPLSRVAIDPWLERVSVDAEAGKTLEEIRKILDRECGEARVDTDREMFFFSWCSPARDPQEAIGSSKPRKGVFRYDAGILLQGGLESMQMAVEREGERRGPDSGAEAEVRRTLEVLELELRPPIERLHAAHGAPPPYYVLLAMDGDGVGRALTRRAKDKPISEALTERVRALDAFADEAEKVVRAYHGCAFYIGGDDLMAYLPLDSALDAARDLATLFDDKTAVAFPEEAAVSLSGGLVIAHVRADLRAMRSQAQQALKGAKVERRKHLSQAVPESEQKPSPTSWLEIRELPRSGGKRQCHGPLGILAASLDGWRDHLEGGRLSPRSAHFLMELSERLRPAPGDPLERGRGPLGEEPGVELARQRVLAQLQGPEGVSSSVLEERLRDLRTWDDVDNLAAELKIAVRYRRHSALRPQPLRGGVRDAS